MKQHEYIWIVLLLELILIELTTGLYNTLWIILAFISIILYTSQLIIELLKWRKNRNE